MPTTPVVPMPRWMGMPQSVSCWATTSAVRTSWKHSSGWAWMSLRMAAMLAASVRMVSMSFMVFSLAIVGLFCQHPLHHPQRIGDMPVFSPAQRIGHNRVCDFRKTSHVAPARCP
jgi:hypothetical protein